jgi:PKD repeat protein
MINKCFSLCCIILFCFSLKSQILNEYASVSEISNFNNFDYDTITISSPIALNINDIIMIYQVKGVTWNYNFGLPSGYGYTGHFEIKKVININNSYIIVDSILNDGITYSPDNAVQIVKIGRYTDIYKNLIISNKITAKNWDGSMGGVVAIIADTLVLKANIDVTGKGFRGADPSGIDGAICWYDNTTEIQKSNFPLSKSLFGGIKGESVVSFDTSNIRGKMASYNGGGGGNGYHSGGGGGGNYYSGGDGGYEAPLCASAPLDMGGNGGIGLSTGVLNNPGFPLIVFGGGGGCSNHAAGFNASKGGSGGGIVLIMANAIKSNGFSIISNGESVTDTCTAGAGGGGAGGTIILDVNNYLDKLTLSVKGGNGGSVKLTPPIPGPGGGGAGGFVRFNNNLSDSVILQVNEGNQGNGFPFINKNALSGSQGYSIGNFVMPVNDFLFNILPDDQEICEGDIPKELIASTPKGGTSLYLFVWRRSQNKSVWDEVSNTLTYQPNALYNTTYFQRIVHSIDNSNKIIISDTSDIITIKVIPKVENNTISLDTNVICKNVQMPLINLNQSNTISGGRGTGTYSYIWQDYVTDWKTAPGDSDNFDYLPPTQESTKFRRIVKSGACTSVSNPVSISILPKIVNNIIHNDQKILLGENITPIMGDAVTGGNGFYNYIWQLSSDKLNWESEDSSSFPTSLYIPKPVKVDTLYFRRKIISGSFNTCVDTSNIVTVQVVYNSAPEISDLSFILVENTSIGLSIGNIKATDIDPNTTLSYLVISGNTGNAFIIDSTGNIIVSGLLDYETKNSYNLVVVVSDNGSPSLSDTSNISITITDISEQGVIAEFGYVVAEQSVTFTSKSSSNVTSWLWSFGDGSSFNGENTIHTYLKAGKYQVCLTVVDPDKGATDKICKNVIVGDAICRTTAHYTYSTENLMISLKDVSTGNVSKRYWNFGDGIISTEINPSHVYTNAGSYLISLSVSDSAKKCTDFFTNTVQIGKIECSASYDYFVNSSKVKFTNTSEGNFSSFFWDFNDGSYSTNKDAEHLYNKEGKYLVSLAIANSDLSCIDRTIKEVQIGDMSCNAEFTYFVDSVANTVYFTDQNTNESISLLWGFGDGISAITHNPKHRYKEPGYFKVGLSTFNNNSGCLDYNEKLILIGSEGIDCAADFYYIASTSNNNSIQFIDNSIGSINKYLWNYGDGLSELKFNPLHYFNKSGYFNVCLTVVNNKGISNIACKNVSVATTTLNNCKAAFIYNVDSIKKTAVFLNTSSGQIDAYKWDFGDGESSILENPIPHIYTKPGYYLVSLEVLNSTSNCSDNNFQLINISKPDSFIVIFTYLSKVNDYKNGGYPVDFIGAGLGDDAKLKWSFGDETQIDTTTNTPTHTFQDTGRYDVCLMYSDPVTGESAEYCQWITTYDLCKSDTIRPNAICKDLTVNLNTSGFVDITESQVDSGSNDACGIKSRLLSQTHFTSGGTKNVILTIKDNQGNTSTCSSKIAVLKDNSFSEALLFTNLSIYPNPFKNQLILSYDVTENTDIKIFITDIVGRKIISIPSVIQPNSKNNIVLNTEYLNIGTYILQIESSNRYTKKMLIIKN